VDFSVWKIPWPTPSYREKLRRMWQAASAVVSSFLWMTTLQNHLFSPHRDETRLHLHPFDPITDLRKIVQGETTLMGDMCVGEERNVGDGIVADEEIIFFQVIFYDSERCPAAFAPGS
jgi:hypothetical protein